MKEPTPKGVGLYYFNDVYQQLRLFTRASYSCWEIVASSVLRLEQSWVDFSLS